MTVTERITLKRAGFTDRQISDHRTKFENLLRINPCLTSELAQFEKLRAECESQQAKIDALMLEFCPDEMTPEQKARWAECQVPSGDKWIKRVAEQVVKVEANPPIRLECPDARLCITVADLLDASGFTGTNGLRGIAARLQTAWLKERGL